MRRKVPVETCHVCGSKRVTYRARLRVTKLGILFDYVRLLEPFRNWFLFFLPKAEPLRTALCLDCGTVRFFVLDTEMFDLGEDFEDRERRR
jgi:hypothetical protein